MAWVKKLNWKTSSRKFVPWDEGSSEWYFCHCFHREPERWTFLSTSFCGIRATFSSRLSPVGFEGCPTLLTLNQLKWIRNSHPLCAHIFYRPSSQVIPECKSQSRLKQNFYPRFEYISMISVKAEFQMSSTHRWNPKIAGSVSKGTRPQPGTAKWQQVISQKSP